ncbi:hypothetical protein KIW84_075891 [Lathyrus oleraceus]|uniref:ATP-dependent DNA helicase n=1 Tax=Pisum sativum TaxID=3888 RepID=A0A9D5A2J9_PEA|nr:hypothetical protein KIW84_075891 [Pisum sativum]
MDYERDINVIRCDGNLKKVQETKRYYDPLQYPILFPFGTHGWDINTTNCNGQRVSCRAYYSYMLQILPNDQSMLLHADRLLQQYVVDNYVKIESGRLRWIKEHQSDIRSELYQGLHDALHVGETNAENIGKRTILPSPFIDGRRDMIRRYEDGMAIVLNGGKPNIFLTMTCNPSWSVITSELLPFQTPQDRPDLLTRIFRSKFEKLKDDVINKGVLGKVKSYMYVTEFQKRGLPHVYMLLVLESNDKLRDLKDYDSMVRAEIPKLECEPQLHEVVVRHMIHGPCGIINRKSPCMKDGHCKKRYPKQFLDETRQGTDSYPEYRRRFDESVSLGKDRFVIAFKVSSIYTKYVYKGPDRVAMEVHKGSYMDEVQQYVDARWICPTSWEYLLTNNGMTFGTFKKSVEDKGFLETDHSIHDCLVEATSLRMPYALRRGEIVLATTSSGIAATLLPSGRTAHSRYKIPIHIQLSSICGIQKKKDLANLIRVAAAIIWDEAPMTNKNCLEALGRSLQDICSNNAPFGGKVLIMGGDFCQVLPVVRKGTKAQMISACIVQSHLWNHAKILCLRQNMRSLHDQEFVEFLIRIGDGVEPTKPDDMVRLPLHIAISWEGEHSIQVLIQHIFPNLELHGWDAPYMVQRAILTPTNDDVQKLNDMIIDQFPGEEHNLLSFDEVEGDNYNLYQQEFLNSIAQVKMSRKVDYVKDINDSKETWRLAVRIMDGDRIQVLIRHDHLLKWKEVIKENMTCIINNGSVYNNDFQWKVCDHSKKIVFLGGTTMKAIELQNIPPKGYFFKDFGEILQGKCKTDRLEDIIGAVSEINHIQSNTPGKKVVVSVVLKDLKGNCINCNLWEIYGSKILAYYNDPKNNGAIVILLTHAMVKDGQVSNAWSGSKLLINEDIPEIQDFMSKLPTNEQKEKPTQSAKSLSNRSGGSQYSPVERRCSSKASNPEKAYECSCGQKVEQPISRYKIEIYVSNGESKYRFVFWDSECAAILGMTAEFMHNSMVENGEDDPMVYPDELEMLLNKKMTFRVKVQPTFSQASVWKLCDDEAFVKEIKNDYIVEDNQSKTEYAKLVPNKENLETSAQTLSASGENDPESIILMTPAKDVVIADKGEEVDFEASGATQLSGTKPSKKLKIEPSF